MKKVLMVLSVSLFLFSCGETNKSESGEVTQSEKTKSSEGSQSEKTESSEVTQSEKTEISEVNQSENKIIGKWELAKFGDMIAPKNNFFFLKKDGSIYQKDDGEEIKKRGTWLIKDNNFCEKLDGLELCSKYKLEENYLTIFRLNGKMIFGYRKVN